MLLVKSNLQVTICLLALHNARNINKKLLLTRHQINRQFRLVKCKCEQILALDIIEPMMGM